MHKRFLAVLLIIIVCTLPIAAADVFIYTDASSGQYSQGLTDLHSVILPAEYVVWEDEFAFHFINEDGRCGFYDKASACLHPAVYDFVGYGVNPYDPVLVETSGFIGYVYPDRCEYAIPPIYLSYHEFSCFEDGYAIVGKKPGSLPYGCEYVLIDREGKEILFPEGFEPYSLPVGEYVTIIDPFTGLLGLGNVSGEVIIRPNYDGFGTISEGLISYKLDNRWGHMDLLGNCLLPPIFELYEDEDHTTPWGYSFSDGIATLYLTTEDGNYVVRQIDIEGNWLP